VAPEEILVASKVFVPRPRIGKAVRFGSRQKAFLEALLGLHLHTSLSIPMPAIGQCIRRHFSSAELAAQASIAPIVGAYLTPHALGCSVDLEIAQFIDLAKCLIRAASACHPQTIQLV
jgi:hypothetical protein